MSTNYENMTMQELKEEARKAELVGFSRLNKEDLIAFLRQGKAKGEGEFNHLTVQELKQLCKQKGIGPYSKLNRAELIALLSGSHHKGEKYVCVVLKEGFEFHTIYVSESEWDKTYDPLYKIKNFSDMRKNLNLDDSKEQVKWNKSSSNKKIVQIFFIE